VSVDRDRIDRLVAVGGGCVARPSPSAAHHMVMEMEKGDAWPRSPPCDGQTKD
jgi:hypothetical protein